MASAEKTEQVRKLKKKFQITTTTVRSDWNNHYNTVSERPNSHMEESFNKDLYPLNPVLEDHYATHQTTSTPIRSSINAPTSPFPPSSNRSVFRKPNFFGKRDSSSSSSSSPNQSSKASKTPGKMKNFITSIRQRSKSTCSDTPPVIISNTIMEQEIFVEDSVFSMASSLNVDSKICELSFSDIQLNEASNNSNNSSNGNNNNMAIGPDQYLAYHRERTQSDTTKFLIARKRARDKSSLQMRHHSTMLADEEVDARLLIWKDPKRGTRIYRMPSTSQRFSDSDESINPDLVYTRLLDKHSCYDVTPNSSKIVIFDSRLSLKKAFLAQAKDGVKAAILWDTQKQNFSGMLTITDFIKILYRCYTTSSSSSSSSSNVQDIENASLHSWKAITEGVVHCGPEDTLLHALKLLSENRLHRLLVLDRRLGNAINILTHKRILAFIHYNMTSLDTPPFMSRPLSSFSSITTDNVITITYDMRLIEVLRLFIERRISAVPVVDQAGRLINIFAKYDFSRLAYDNLYSNLDRPVRDVINTKNETRTNLHTVQPHITLHKAIHKIVTASVHRLVMVDDDKKVVGMATLSDLLRCLVLQPEEDSMK